MIGKSPQVVLLLGSGELGKELVISLKRLGNRVIAVDRYSGAPAMQVADAFEVIDMLDGKAVGALAEKYRPDLIVPEIEAIRTEKLLELETDGFTVIPSAQAAHLTMNRDWIRDLAAKELGLRTAKYSYATREVEMREQIEAIGLPVVVKPVMSSSGKGQSVVKRASEISAAWRYACEGMRGDRQRVIIEEFIDFELEITQLTVKPWKGKTLFLDPIGHRQERGDYRESWIPAKVPPRLLADCRKMAKKITDRLGGAGIFGVEFFITRKEAIFSELSPRPHDTGMVTLASQDLSEFDLHARAILGLPIPEVRYYGPTASAVVLADRDFDKPIYRGVEKALSKKGVEVRLFGKPTARPYRRMAVVLARGKNVKAARQTATRAASLIEVRPG